MVKVVEEEKPVSDTRLWDLKTLVDLLERCSL